MTLLHISTVYEIGRERERYVREKIEG